MNKEILHAIGKLLKEELEPIKNDIKEMKSEIKEIKSEIKEIKATQEEQKTEIKEMKSEIREIKVTQEEQKAEIKEMKEDIKELKVMTIDLETKNASRHLDINSTINELRKDLTNVEIITSSNWNEIAKLKMIK